MPSSDFCAYFMNGEVSFTCTCQTQQQSSRAPAAGTAGQPSLLQNTACQWCGSSNLPPSSKRPAVTWSPPLISFPLNLHPPPSECAVTLSLPHGSCVVPQRCSAQHLPPHSARALEPSTGDTGEQQLLKDGFRNQRLLNNNPQTLSCEAGQKMELHNSGETSGISFSTQKNTGEWFSASRQEKFPNTFLCRPSFVSSLTLYLTAFIFKEATT